MTGMPFPGCVPELTDGVVRLRAHRPDDAERIVEQSTDAETMRWTTVPRPYGIEEARDFLAEIERDWSAPAGVRRWAVTDAEDVTGRYLGTIDLRPRGGGVAEVGFALHPQARGSGSMAGAVRLACRWWFGEGGTRVHWLAVRGNFASWRVAWSCGFTHHGTIPQSHPDPDDPTGPALDVWRASLGADDVMEPRTPWEDVPVLDAEEGHGIRLRPWRDRDIEALEPRDQPEHYMPARGVLDADTFPEWLMIRREQMSLGKVLSWCAADTTTDAALGEVLVFVTEGTLDDDTAELGYQVVPSGRGRGVATTGSRALVAHAFAARTDGGLGMRRLVAQTAEDNVASNKVLDRLGFTIWGRETAADVLPGGRAVDALHWERLRD
jgi:RimJ/RimL family protein N-acetyltransferase